MIKEAIRKVSQKKHLTFQEAKDVFYEIFDEKASNSQVASFLTGLSILGEEENEIAAAATVVREKAIRIYPRERNIKGQSNDEPIIDTCGTGGSGVSKFNISTAVSFVVSSAGVKVAKHGNRAVSSRSGSADVFEVLGIKIDVSPRVMEQSIKEIGIGFLFAPLYHKAFKSVALVRKDIGIRTIFNIIGPLCNPAFVSHQLLGVSDEKLLRIAALALNKMGIESAFVVYGDTLKDEITLTGKTKVIYLHGGGIEELDLMPSNFGLKECSAKDLEADTPEQSASIILDIFNAKKSPARDVVLANAAACFYILGMAGNLKAGVSLAEQLIDTGKVKNKYYIFKDFIGKNG
ncbi:MAG: anthranilate phosphoribosyltransferase [Candidatus Omnitrophica bacterium 4484_171]|nr:MAG: anthranilate phosphoribosyltransferase [Candidatus Omnitrophica bacterium 4484_171]